MDISVTLPEPGGGVGTPCVLRTYTPAELNPKKVKQLKRHVDLVAAGTKRTIILLGPVVKQRAHWVQNIRKKIICSSRLGQCHSCSLVGLDHNVGASHYECYAPCAVLDEREYIQSMLVVTDDMYEGNKRYEGLKQLLTDGPARGHSFELSRPSIHSFKWTAVRRSPRALAHVLPRAFDLLPWIRLRFDLQQEPDRVLTVFAPFKLSDLGDTPELRTPEVELAPSDRQTAEEWEKTKAAIEKWKENIKAPVPSAPQPAPVPAPAPVSAPELSPEPTEEGEPATAITGKVPGGLLATEAMQQPANYGPRTRVVGGETTEPIVTPPSRDAMRKNREASNARFKQQAAEERERKEEGAKARDGAAVSNRLGDIASALDVITSGLVAAAPSANGKHLPVKGTEKGGAK